MPRWWGAMMSNIFMDQYGRLWLVSSFGREPLAVPQWSFVPSKVTPPCVECSDMKLRSYKPGRVCPFCQSTVTHETITYACYYEHSESGLWAYIPYVHTLKNCMVCGEAWPEYLDPAMKGQIEDE